VKEDSPITIEGKKTKKGKKVKNRKRSKKNWSEYSSVISQERRSNQYNS
jgi:hypothetical protein